MEYQTSSSRSRALASHGLSASSLIFGVLLRSAAVLVSLTTGLVAGWLLKNPSALPGMLADRNPHDPGVLFLVVMFAFFMLPWALGYAVVVDVPLVLVTLTRFTSRQRVTAFVAILGAATIASGLYGFRNH